MPRPKGRPVFFASKAVKYSGNWAQHRALGVGWGKKKTFYELDGLARGWKKGDVNTVNGGTAWHWRQTPGSSRLHFRGLRSRSNAILRKGVPVLGTTRRSITAIGKWIGRWLHDHPNYAIVMPNCQDFTHDLCCFLVGDATKMPPKQMHDWMVGLRRAGAAFRAELSFSPAAR